MKQRDIMDRSKTDIEFPTAGKCTCGDMKYQILREPMFVHCCHCTWCQRETGTAFALNALLEKENVKIIQGTPETIDTPSNSGKGQKITRCPRCKIALWSNYRSAGDAIRFVRVGTLKAARLFPPDIHIFTSTKQSWVVLNDDTPVVEAYYDRNDYWPRQSIERRLLIT